MTETDGTPIPELGRFAAEDQYADVAAIIVTFNSARDIEGLIDDLRTAARDLLIRLVVVDNQSADETPELVRRNDDVILLEPRSNLGYGGAINAGLSRIGSCNCVLVLNADITLDHQAVARLHEAAQSDSTAGAVVPLMIKDGTIYHSLRREPSLTRAIGDALMGGSTFPRPRYLAESDTRSSSYAAPNHEADWATGAAVLIPNQVIREVGQWWDDFLMYSEETDYFRRIRATGRRIRFEPSAVVTHIGGGSGPIRGETAASLSFYALMTVNRVRYIERYHGRLYAWLFRAVVAVAEAVRFRNSKHRYAFRMVINRERWKELPTVANPRFNGDVG